MPFQDVNSFRSYLLMFRMRVSPLTTRNKVVLASVEMAALGQQQRTRTADASHQRGEDISSGGATSVEVQTQRGACRSRRAL